MIASRLIWLNNLRLRLDVLKNSFVTRTTMTEPLSPAAQAVLDAVCDNTEPDCDTQHLIAAALRAAAVYCTRERRILMTIAAELEGAASR
jgi:hypothetical protein